MTKSYRLLDTTTACASARHAACKGVVYEPRFRSRPPKLVGPCPCPCHFADNVKLGG